MTMERWVRLIAGSIITISLLLGWLVSPYFFLLTAFVGLNLFQSSLTRWCLMEDILSKFGVPRCCQEPRPDHEGNAVPGA